MPRWVVTLRSCAKRRMSHLPGHCATSCLDSLLTLTCYSCQRERDYALFYHFHLMQKYVRFQTMHLRLNSLIKCEAWWMSHPHQPQPSFSLERVLDSSSRCRREMFERERERESESKAAKEFLCVKFFLCKLHSKASCMQIFVLTSSQSLS